MTHWLDASLHEGHKWVREARARDSTCPDELSELCQDDIRWVRIAALNNPHTRPEDVIRLLSDPDDDVREAAANRVDVVDIFRA